MVEILENLTATTDDNWKICKRIEVNASCLAKTCKYPSMGMYIQPSSH